MGSNHLTKFDIYGISILSILFLTAFHLAGLDTYGETYGQLDN